MKNPILRVLVAAILFALIAAVVVMIIGYELGWKTSTQFSDGFFWAGAFILSAGFLNLMGMFSQRKVSGLQYSQSAVHLDMAERYNIWEADVLRGHKLLALLSISGLLLLGLSGLAIALGKQY